MAFILAPVINDKIDEAEISIFFISSPIKGAENNSPFDPIRKLKIFQDSKIANMPLERPSGYIITYTYFVFGKWIGFNILAKKDSPINCIKEYIEGPYLVLGEPLPSEREIELAKKNGSFIIKEIDYYEKIQNHDKAFVILYRVDVTETKILMLHYFKNERGGERYGFPGGHIDHGETAVAAAMRELREETGGILVQKDLKFVHFLDISKGPNDNRKYFYFAARDYEGFPQSPEPGRYSVEWRNINSLPNETPFHIKQVIRCVLEEKYYSIFDIRY